MRYFAEYIVGRNGPIDVFLQPQTPRLVADEVARKLTSPAYLDGARHFAIVVWALPDGMTHIDEVPESSPAWATFIQCGGSAAAMSVEIRVTHEDDSYEHYAVAREPVADPGAWTTITWDNGGPSPSRCVCTLRRSSPASRQPPSSAPTSRTGRFRPHSSYAGSTSSHRRHHAFVP